MADMLRLAKESSPGPDRKVTKPHGGPIHKHARNRVGPLPVHPGESRFRTLRQGRSA